MKSLAAIALLFVVAASTSAQEIPEHARRVSWGKGWVCVEAYVERANGCVHLSQATDDEIRHYLIDQSISAYSGSCPCPYNIDRAGRRCGRRSAYLRPGGAAPLCFPGDVTDALVEAMRERYKRPKT